LPKKPQRDRKPKHYDVPFRRPEEFDAALELVVGQEDLQTKLKSVFSQYTLYLQDPTAGKPMVCAYGESGSGKTFTIELLAKYSGLPVTIASAASLSPPSYKGTTIQDLLARHWMAFHTDIGVIYLDELNKWCRHALTQGQANAANPEDIGNGVRSQHDLLRMVESEQINFLDLGRDIDEMQHVNFNTQNLLWIFAGSFVGLPQLIRRRLSNHHLDDEEVWAQAQPADFIRYGMVDELAKRIRTWAWTKPLNAIDLLEILRKQEMPKWVVRGRAIGCEVTVSESAMAECARHAFEEHIGARGAAQLMNRSMDDIFYHLSSAHVAAYTVDHNAITTGRIELEVPA